MTKIATAEKPEAEAPGPIGRNDKQKMLDPKRLSSPGFGWVTHEASIPADVPMEHIASGQFWRLCERRFTRGDHVRFCDDFLTRFGELVCVGHDVQTGSMDMRVLWTKEVEPAQYAHSETLGFQVKDLGKFDGFAIIRDSDGHVMQKNIKSHDEAMRTIRVVYVPQRSQADGRMA